jgi:phosphatidylinositol alpha 1,6-mannosyltransferase
MDGEHPNRTVLFLDNSIPIPFLHDPNHPDESYHLGFSLSRSIKRQIEAFEPTLIHITVPDCTCLHLIQYARTKELPLMGTYHSNIPDYMDHYPRIGWLKHILIAFFRHQYNFLQALYVPTPFIKKQLTNKVQMDQVTNLGVWGRGIDLDRFSPTHRSDEFRKQYGFQPDDVVLLWCGRLVPEKRPDIFAYVVKRLAAEGVPFKCLVVGAGPCEDEVKSLPNTTFAGWMSGDMLAVAYASSDIFLFPSAVETFGNVTLEAAASGLPLVVEAGCSGHLVNHGVNGFACQDGDLDGYYNSTLCLVLDNMRRNSMSEEGRKFSLQFEKRAVCRRMIDNYSHVTDEFYSEYGGRHANRDELYTKDKSFLGGNYPRPFALVAVEYLFIMIFRVMYQMATIFFNVQERLLSSSRQAVNNSKVSPPPSKSVTRKTVKSQPNSPLRKSSDLTDRTVPLLVPPTVPSQLTTLNRIVEIDERSDASDVDSHNNNQQHSSLMKALDEEMDDNDADTNSTATFSSVGSTSTNNPVFSCRRRSSTDERLPVSHILAIGFVQCLMFQTRMENRFRKRISYMTSPSKWGVIKRKRKNSNVFMKDDYQNYEESSSSSTTMLDLQRSSTGSDLSCEDIGMIVINSNSRGDDRLNMRRPTTTVATVSAV